MGDRRTRLRLWVVQAAFGDCLVVEGQAGDRTRRILIDGGPGGTYQAALRPVLVNIGKTGSRIDVAVLSHIDNDHILGLLDLFEEMREAPADRDAGSLPPIDSLWHNSFARAVGGADIEPKVRAVLRDGGRLGAAMPAVAGVLRGVGEGDALRAAALALDIPIGAGFRDGQVLVGQGQPPGLEPLSVTVVGPSRTILDRLRTQWLGWLARHRAKGVAGDGVRSAAISLDQSVPNLSSIVLLVELDGRSILLTGDARADQVLDGMGEAGTLDGDGRRHVSILKMPHHGSIRNITPDFLRAVTADTYVISADGRYGNPDFEALALIVEVAHEQGRRIELAMTNTTDLVGAAPGEPPAGEIRLPGPHPAPGCHRPRPRRPGAPPPPGVAVDKLRAPFLIAALILAILVLLIELGTGLGTVFLPGRPAGHRDPVPRDGRRHPRLHAGPHDDQPRRARAGRRAGAGLCHPRDRLPDPARRHRRDLRGDHAGPAR